VYQLYDVVWADVKGWWPSVVMPSEEDKYKEQSERVKSYVDAWLSLLTNHYASLCACLFAMGRQRSSN
jgi:hypothetical protein